MIQKKFAHLAKQFGTPYYAYDAEIIAQQFKKLLYATHGLADIFYSLKANPNIGIAQQLLSHGAHAEVCSLSEFKTAEDAGYQAENIIFVGPCKSDEVIQRCVEQAIFAIVCESFYEMQRVDAVAKASGKKVNILIRVNPNFYVDSAPLKMGGVPSQFGIDFNEMPATFPLKSYPHLKIRGIHIYNGTRILNAKDLAENIKKIFQLSDLLSQQWKMEFDVLDLGGGFGVAYFDQENHLDIELLSQELREPIQQFKAKHPNMRLIIESGRFLVAESGFFVTKICDIKPSHGEKFLITDGGMNCHMAATGIGSFLRRNFKILSLSSSRVKNKAFCTYNISGPLCTPGDLIGKKVLLPEVNIGDLIIIVTSGAYGPSASPIFFLGHGHPSEILATSEKNYLIRKRDTVEDILKNQLKIN